MTQTVLKKKLVYFAWILIFMLILLLIGVALYFKTSRIDLSQKLKITVAGVNGEAQIVSIENIQDEPDPVRNIYLSQIQYTAEPDTGLYNGQTVFIEAEPDLALSRAYQYFPYHRSVSLQIEGLSDEYSEIEIIYGESNEAG